MADAPKSRKKKAALYMSQRSKQEKLEVLKNREEPKHKTNYIETMGHLVKAYVGAGIFSMPNSIKESGLVIAPILTLFMAVLTTYNVHIMVECSNMMKAIFELKVNPNFPETIELCFSEGRANFKKYSHFMRVSIKTMLVLIQLSFCSVYLVSVSAMLHQVAQSRGLDMSKIQYISIIMAPAILITLIPSLKFLAPVSIIANILMIAALVGVCVVPMIHEKPSTSDKNILPAKPNELAHAFGEILFCFEGLTVMLPLVTEMKQPRKFTILFGVLNVGIFFITVVMLIVGFIGYFCYGEDIQGNVALNLPKGATETAVVQIFLGIAILFSFPIQMYVAAEMLWRDISEAFGPFKYPLLGNLITRFLLCWLTYLPAVLIPKIKLIIALIGSLLGSYLALWCPSLGDISRRLSDDPELLKHFERKKSRDYFYFFMNGLSLIIGVVGTVLGTFFSVKDIVLQFHEGADSFS